MSRYKQGKYSPKNRSKYKGDPTNIMYRSRWELLLMRYLDLHPHVIEWSSETVIIPYISPIDGKYHRYFVDFYARMQGNDGKTRTALIEVKPNKERKAPKPRKTKNGAPTKGFLNEVQTYGVNQAKWAAAQSYCDDRGWSFIVMDEYNLGIAKPKARS